MTSEVIEFQFARQRIGLPADTPIVPLSPREHEVVSLVAAGRTDGEIAEQLFISKKTASVHVANIKGKLGAATRVEIAMLAARLGLADESSSSSSAADDRQRTARRPVVCPFKGLASFDRADAAFFFGRERVVAELVARLAGSTFLGVVGPSGSGKSSVVRAGLVPAVVDGVLPGSELWTVAVARPGDAPWREVHHAVAAALAPDRSDQRGEGSYQDLLHRLPARSRLLLVVDQFEEIFTICQDDIERAAFVRDLVALARDPQSRVLVVVVVRADFYGRCAAYGDLAELLAADHVLVGAMTADELSRAIEMPARAARLRVDPELTSRLVAEVLDEPGGLPLLSTTLLDLWQRRDGPSLRLATYEQIGGVRGAVSRLAESAYSRLTVDQQAIARAIFLRLAVPAGDDVVGRPVPIRELDAERNADVARVLGVLTDSRLVTVADGSVEVAHEAVLREWPRLRAWLEEDAEGRRLWVHLSRAAEEWEVAGGDLGELYRGGRLAAALEWSEMHDLDMNERERSFLAASRAASEREMERQRRTNRRLQGLLAGAAAFLVLAIAAGGIAALQLSRAEEEARRAEAAATLARSRELTASAVAVLGDDPGLSKLLALAAASTADPPLESISALHTAFAADRVISRYAWPDGSAEGGVFADLDASGRLIVATRGYGQSGHDYLEVTDRIRNEVLWSFAPQDALGAVGLGLFSPDGKYVIAGVYRDPFAPTAAMPIRDRLGAFVWEAETGQLVQRFDLGDCGGVVTAVSEQNLLVRTKASPSCFVPPPDDETALELVDLRSGGRTTLTSRLFAGAESLSADGRYAAYDDAAGASRVSIVIDLQSGERVLEIPVTQPETDRVRDLSRDGSLLLYGDDPIQVWDVAAGDVQAEFRGHSNFSNSARFALSGDSVFSTGRDAGLRQWVASSGKELLALSGIGVDNGRPAASNGGLVLVPQGGTARALLVDIRARGELGFVEARTPGDAEWLMLWDSLLFSHPYAAFADLRNGREVWTMRVVDIDRGEVQYSLPGGGGQAGFELSPDGTRFVRQEASGAVEATYGPIKIRDLRSGDEIRELQGLCSYQNSDPSPENIGACNAYPKTPFPIWAYRLQWSPDGSMIAAVPAPAPGWGGFVAVWSVDEGALLPTKRLDEGLFVQDVIFSPDSKYLILSYGDGMLQKWSTDDWEPVGNHVTLEATRSLEFFGYSPDGITLHALSGYQAGGAALYWLDATTLEEVRPRTDPIGEGTPTSMALSPDGSKLATGAQDGFVRVWDALTGRLVHEITMGAAEVLGVTFITDTHVAVVPTDGNLRLLTIDKDELLEIVRESLTRGFTEAECVRFNFFDRCPTLSELRRE